MPPQRKRRIALLVLGSALLLRLSPMSVYNATLLLLGNSCGWAWQTVRAVPAPPPPLKSAILNVTSDFDQLAHLVVDFMQQPGMDPDVEQRFKVFLAERATKSYPRLESLLDWLLAVYKFIFPFLLISMAAKRTGGSKDAGAEGAADAAEDPAQLGPDAPALPAIARRGSEQQNGDLLATALSSRVGVAQGDAAAQALQHQRLQLRGVNGASGGFNALLSNSSGGSGAIRAGSQSPHGPETPVEGGGSRLPLHPTARHGAAAKTPCQRQRLATASEIDADYSF